MDYLPISIVLLNKLRVAKRSAKMTTTNNKKEGKDEKYFSTLLKIAKKGQLLIENTVS